VFLLEVQMSRIYKLDIYQNAIDSLNEGIEMCKKALKDESKYKFSIILISNFVELLLKNLVELQSPLLIFEKPYEKKYDDKTISWKQALQILINSRKTIKEELIIDLNKLNDIRNKIVHYKFEYNIYEIDSIIISVIDGLCQLYKDITDKNVNDDVNDETRTFLDRIKNDYLNQLHQAQFKAKEEAEENGIEVYSCSFCGEEDTAVENNEGIYCYFCEETDYEEECSCCSVPCLISEMEYIGEDDYGNSIFLCENCSYTMSKE